MNEDQYYNLIKNDISDLTIEKNSHFDCVIKDSEGKVYKGFILAKSKTGKAVTVCDISFHLSTTDNRFQPRPTFRRTNESLQDKPVTGNSLVQRISFQQGADGYREFWIMVSFLNSFKNIIDTGNFSGEYQVVSDAEFSDYLKSKETEGDLGVFIDLVESSGTDSAAILHSATTLKLLKTYRSKIKEFIDSDATETDVQNWIDEDGHKYRKERCLIFGLEFINHKREAGASGDRYDLLTRIGASSEERVLIELKSPSSDVFDVKSSDTINNPKKEYSISSSLSRAIPQILEYKHTLETKLAGDSELQKIGEDGIIQISKCIIVIGKSIDDTRLMKNLRELRKSLSSGLEIWTYSDLYNKIDSTIQNLESNKDK